MLTSQGASTFVRSFVERNSVGLKQFRDRCPIAHGVLVTLLSALGVYLTSKLLDPLVFYSYLNAICWPVDGLIIGALLLCSRKHWPWILLGYVFASLPAEIVAARMPAPMIVMDTVCNLFEMVFAALSLPAFSNLPEWLRRPRLILRFSVLAVIAAPLISAVIWATFAYFYAGWEFWVVIRRWVSSDALGIALFTPLVLVLFSRETYLLVRSDRWVQTLFTFGVLIGVSWSVFYQNAYPVAFIVFPVLVVIVNRIGFPGAVLAVSLLTVIAAKATIQGTGPFLFVQGQNEPYRIMTLQIYLTTAMIMSFAITLTALERNDFQEQLKLALQQMEVLATHDGLTGLGNRRLFDQTLEAEWGRARRDGKSIALLLLDADCFKSYNDMYGHIAGDECLCAIAASVGATVTRGGDLVARYGGEEFVVLLPGLALEQASQVAESVRQAVESLQIEHKGNNISALQSRSDAARWCPTGICRRSASSRPPTRRSTRPSRAAATALNAERLCPQGSRWCLAERDNAPYGLVWSHILSFSSFACFLNFAASSGVMNEGPTGHTEKSRMHKRFAVPCIDRTASPSSSSDPRESASSCSFG